jgi:hypothetical protein
MAATSDDSLRNVYVRQQAAGEHRKCAGDQQTKQNKQKGLIGRWTVDRVG